MCCCWWYTPYSCFGWRRESCARRLREVMNQRLRHMIRKEFRQTLREPRARGMLIMPPLIQLLVFGYAVNLDVNSAIIAWMDQDHTPQSRELLADFRGSGRF